MKIEEAKICLDCDEIYEGTSLCPNCSGRIGWPLREWIGTIERKAAELQEASRSDLLLGDRPEKIEKIRRDPTVLFHRA